MHKTKRIIKRIILAYLLLSLLLSVAYNLAPYGGEIARRRCGLLVCGVEHNDNWLEIWLLNPLSLYTDDWIASFQISTNIPEYFDFTLEFLRDPFGTLFYFLFEI